MVNIYSMLFYSAFVSHLIFLIYYLVAAFFSVTGILAKYEKLNRANIYLISVIILLQLAYGACPATVWQNFAADRIGAARINSFVVYLFDKFGWHIEAMTVLLFFGFLSVLIIGSYIFYKIRDKRLRKKNKIISK